MKQSAFQSILLGLPAFALLACTAETPPPAASVAQAPKAEVTPPASQPSTTGAEATPAAAPAATTPDPSLAFARGAAEGYDGGAKKLQTEHDLSKVKVPEAKVSDGHSADDGHDHDHEAAVQDGGAFTPAGQAQQNKGRFELAEGAAQVKDLGRLRQGETASFDFPFVSKGEEPLVVTGVKPSCGCTKAEIKLVAEDGSRMPYTKGDPIPVGQAFVLESEISTDGKPAGPFNAQITLYGNDIRGTFNVRLTADVEAVLTLTPSPSVFFGRITTKDRVEQTVTVTTTRGEPFQLSLAQEGMQEPVKVDFAAKNPDAEGRSNEWEIHVALGPNTEIGMRNYPLNFKTDIPIAHPKYPSKDGSPQTHGFMLTVQAQVTGMVSAEPAFLTFGMVKPGEPSERSLRVTSHDDFQLAAEMPVVIEGLQGQEFPYKDKFEVTVQPVDGGKTADVKVRLTGMPEELNGSFGGVLRLQVGHPFLAELQIRFSGVCRPGLPTTLPLPNPQGTGGK